MSDAPVSTAAQASAPAAPSGALLRDSPGDIDTSLRGPLVTLFLGAVFWLVAGTLLGIVGSIKLHAPGFLADSAWLTAGRIRPAAMNAVVYGFASQAALGVMLWLMSRLGGNRFLFPIPVVLAGKLWNLAVLVGVWAILAGASTGFELLEMPGYASSLLFVAYTMIGLCAAVSFWWRRERALYPSQWFLLAALFWFPWIYSAANLLLVFDPVRGTMQAVVNAWFVNNLLGLWLGAVAIAAIYYFLPKLSGRPLYSAPLAAFGFWTWAVFTAFSGMTSLTGGPVPRWLPALSTAATLGLLVPLVAAGMNWYLTLADRNESSNGDSVFRFTLAAAVCYLAGGLLAIPLAFPTFAAITNLTFVPLAMKQLALLGFVGLAFLGSIYYILPRVLGADWPQPLWVRGHFLCSVLGVAIIVGALFAGGVIQGFNVNHPDVAYVRLARSLTPWIGLSTLGLVWLLAGQVLLALNLVKLFRGWGAARLAGAAEWLVEARPARTGGRS